MTKDKDKIELKPEPKKSDKKSEAELSDKKGKIQSSKSKKKSVAATPVFIALAVLIVGVCAFMAYNYVNNKDSENSTITEESQLSPAEEFDLYELPEGADNESKNALIMPKAITYYGEQNYDRALELLDSINNPSEGIAASRDRLYAQIYEAQGDTEKAQQYFAAILLEQEPKLLEAVKTDPTAHFALAELYASVGETEKARFHYEAYIVAIEAPRDEMAEYEYDSLQEAKQSLEAL